jgi:hypothetical protein
VAAREAPEAPLVFVLCRAVQRALGIRRSTLHGGVRLTLAQEVREHELGERGDAGFALPRLPERKLHLDLVSSSRSVSTSKGRTESRARQGRRALVAHY